MQIDFSVEKVEKQNYTGNLNYFAVEKNDIFAAFFFAESSQEYLLKRLPEGRIIDSMGRLLYYVKRGAIHSGPIVEEPKDFKYVKIT